MHSHVSHNTIGSTLKSNGSCVTSIEWRANRIAHAAAKAAAATHRSSSADRIKLQRTLAAYEYALAELACVTVAANHHPVHVTSEDGTNCTRIMRDSAPCRRPRLRASRIYCAPALPAAVAELDECDVDSAEYSANSLAYRKRAGPRDCFDSPSAKRRRMAKDHLAILDGRSLAHYREERSKRTFQAVSSTPASERLAALRSRLFSSRRSA